MKHQESCSPNTIRSTLAVLALGLLLAACGGGGGGGGATGGNTGGGVSGIVLTGGFDPARTPGTYNGEPGYFRCLSTSCGRTTTNGRVSLQGEWIFVPASRAGDDGTRAVLPGTRVYSGNVSGSSGSVSSLPGSLNGERGTFVCTGGCTYSGGIVTGGTWTFTPDRPPGAIDISSATSTTPTPTPTTRTEFAGLDARVAGYVATAARRAAAARPRAGSITQSSNVRGGITADRVSVTARHGAGRNSYTIRNGSVWSISTADGNPVTLDATPPFDGQELYKRTNGGTLYVDVYSDIEAPGTTTTTTTVPGQPQDVGSGDRIVGLSCLGPRCTADTQEGTLNGVNGTFSCPSGCSIQFGGLHLSSGSTISFEGATFNGRRVGVDEFRVTSATGVTFTPAQMTQPIERTTPDTDYLAGGIWLFVPDNAAGADDVVIGAFGDGSDPFRQGNLRALQGTARYVGEMTGVYTDRSENEAGYVDGNVSLTADFGGGSDLGSIGGSVSGIEADGERFSGSIRLGTAPIGSSDSGFFEGSLSGNVEGTGLSGRWGGQFFGNGEADGRPGSVGGTLGGTSASGDASFIGVFGAYKEE
ncbi:MAG: hypothetical protein OXN16_11795 [Gammaproteobacteria bacterium]|nr:hypothetical protein [Gammaproteobacteria bacterium]